MATSVQDKSVTASPKSKRVHKRYVALGFVVALVLSWALIPPIHLAPTALYILLSVIPGVPTAPIDHALGTPTVQTFQFDGEEGQVVGDLYLPPNGGAHPTLLLINGALSAGRKYPPLVQFAEAMARSGYTVLVPDYPHLLHEELTPDSLADVNTTMQLLTKLPSVKPGHVDIVGFCVGATLAILSAEDPNVPHPQAIVDLAGYVSSEDMIQLITTNTYKYQGSLRHFAADPWVVAAVARSIVAGLPSANDRAVFAPFVRDPDPNNPVAPEWNKVPTASLTPAGLGLLQLLKNRDPSSVVQLIAALPAPMPQTLLAMSPLDHANQLNTPVYSVADRADTYIPNGESLDLAAKRPGLVHIAYVSLLSHVEPTVESQGNIVATVLDLLGGAWQLFQSIETVLLTMGT